MKCNNETISAYFDGLASDEVRHEVTQHLEVCGRCAATLLAYENISRGLKALPAATVPVDIETKLFARLGQQRRQSVYRWQPAFGAFAAVATLLLVALVTLHGSSVDIADYVVYATSSINHAVDVPVDTEVTIDFSAPVDKRFVQDRTRIEPPVEVVFDWRKSEMIIRPKGELQPNTDYRIVVEPVKEQSANKVPVKTQPTAVIVFHTQPEPATMASAALKPTASPPVGAVATAASSASGASDGVPAALASGDNGADRSKLSPAATTLRATKPSDFGASNAASAGTTAGARAEPTTVAPMRTASVTASLSASPLPTATRAAGQSAIAQVSETIGLASGWPQECAGTLAAILTPILENDKALRQSLGCSTSGGHSVAMTQEIRGDGLVFHFSDGNRDYVLSSESHSWSVGDESSRRGDQPNSVSASGSIAQGHPPSASLPRIGVGQYFRNGFVVSFDQRTIFVLQADRSWREFADGGSPTAVTSDGGR